MQSMQFKPYGGLAQLGPAEIPIPTPGPRQILVEVAASSVNPIDWKLRGGWLRWIVGLAGFPATPCFDFAGTVEAIGAEVAGFKPGDRVFGMSPLKTQGAAAEYLALDAAYAAPVPAALDDRAAAGLPLAGMTALQALRDPGGLQAGQRALIVGAAGGVGHYAVQIAKALGAEVTGVCSGRNIELVRSLGADEVIDYTQGEPAASKPGFDVILDTVMNRPFGAWRPLLAEAGVYVSLLAKPGPWLQARTLPLYSRQRLRFTAVKPNRADLDYLAGLAQQGALRTVIDSVYPLAELAAALGQSQTGRARGKIIVAVKAG